MLDGFFRTPLREFARTYENRTPIREVLDGRSPPSYGNGRKRIENATLIRNTLDGSRPPPYGIDPPTLILDGGQFRIDT